MILITGSSNRGHGICCKPDYKGNHCNSDGTNWCSLPAEGTSNPAGHKSIITASTGLNHQMFAFNTIINQKQCGISNDQDSLNMTLTA
jgi:hypothetical protein